MSYIAKIVMAWSKEEACLYLPENFNRLNATIFSSRGYRKQLTTKRQQRLGGRAWKVGMKLWRLNLRSHGGVKVPLIYTVSASGKITNVQNNFREKT